VKLLTAFLTLLLVVSILPAAPVYAELPAGHEEASQAFPEESSGEHDAGTEGSEGTEDAISEGEDADEDAASAPEGSAPDDTGDAESVAKADDTADAADDTNAAATDDADTVQEGTAKADADEPPVPEDGRSLGPKDEPSSLSLFAVPDLSGVYTIGSLLPGSKTLDIPGASQENGAYVQIYTPNTTPAQRFRIARQSDGFYIITNLASGKVLDVRAGVAQSGTPVWQYALNHTNAQKWEILATDSSNSSYYLRSRVGTNLYLDVKGGSSANGTQLHIYQGNATAAQKFSLNKIGRSINDGYYIIHTKSSGKVLDVAGSGTASGTNLQIYESNNSFAQKFHVAYDAASGYYTITNASAMKPIDVAGAGAANGTNVAIYAANGTAAQRWTIAGDGQGSYRIYAACSGLVLDVQGAGLANGTNVQTYVSNNTNAQKWTFEPTVLVVDGSIATIQSALGTVLDAAGNGTADGTNIQTYTANGTQAQKFKVTAVSGGYYRIECLNSGKVLSLSGTNVVLSTYISAGSQHWRPVPAGAGGSYLILENGNGKALDVSGGSKSAGANVQVYARNNTEAQRWRLNATALIADGVYELPSALDTGKVLDIADGSQADGAALQLYAANGTFAQKFSFVKNAKGSYRIIPLNSSKPLEVKDGLIDAATGRGTVWQWTWRSGDATGTVQDWRIEYAGGGNYRILSVLGNGTSCLEVKDGSTADRAEVIVAKRSSSQAQLFKLTGFSSTGSYIPAPLDGIDVSSHQPADIGNRVNYDFMIVKATGGTTYTNPYYVTQANSALVRGKKLGFYHYAGEYHGQNNAVAEAWHFVNGIRSYVGRAALFLDYEEDLPGDDRLWVTAFCNEVYRLTGVKCGIYASGSWARDNINGLWDELGVPLWQANYPYNRDQYGYTHAYTPMVPCSIHQYTSRGILAGHGSNLDLNVCFGSSVAWDYWAARR
jgi:GH25 family lysozyme M1 (1,4-beta-N-acetylmuramidase)